MRAGRSRTPWAAPVVSSPSTGPRAWASPGWPTRPSRPPRRRRRARRSSSAAEPYGASSTYRMLRDPLRTAARGRRAPSPRPWGGRCSRPCERSAPDLLPHGPAAGRRRPGRGARRRPRRTGSTRSSAPTGRPTSSSTCSGALRPGPLVVVVEEAHWADGASVRAARPARLRHGRAGPGRSSSCGEARRAVRARRPACAWSLRPAAAGGRRAPRPRGHRGHPPATARGRRHRRARRGQPALRRGGHPARPGRRARWSSCPSRCTRR